MTHRSHIHVKTTIDQRNVKANRRLRPSLIREIARQALRLSDLQGNFEVNIIVTDDQHIRALNRNFRQIDSPTDVLSFPILEDGSIPVSYPSGRILLGDIVISIDTASRQAREDGVALDHMAAWLIGHGMLHLMGINHDDEDMRRSMNKREQDILRALGIPVKAAKLYTV
ncbi:MAG: rRNA maturation RNase YbeY [bacterium]|nr:rRNA maturation RNase YbeY [bacterium]